MELLKLIALLVSAAALSSNTTGAREGTEQRVHVYASRYQCVLPRSIICEHKVELKWEHNTNKGSYIL